MNQHLRDAIAFLRRLREVHDERRWAKSIVPFYSFVSGLEIPNPTHLEMALNAIRLARWRCRFEAMREVVPGDLTGKIKQPKATQMRKGVAA